MKASPLNPSCWLAWHGVMENDQEMTGCEGRLIRVHLIPRQVIERAGGDVLDPRSYVAACGGIMGLSGHHGAFDSSRRLRIPRVELPETLVEFARTLDLEWWLDRTYPDV